MARPLGVFQKLTDASFAAAVEQYQRGDSLRAVGASFGVSAQSLRVAMVRRGIDRRPRGDWAGASNPAFHDGGAYRNREGYVVVWDRGRKRRQHVVVMERHLGRRMRRGQVVHHINGIRDDNRIENLEVVDVGDHARRHALHRWSARRA